MPALALGRLHRPDRQRRQSICCHITGKVAKATGTCLRALRHFRFGVVDFAFPPSAHPDRLLTVSMALGSVSLRPQYQLRSRGPFDSGIIGRCVTRPGVWFRRPVLDLWGFAGFWRDLGSAARHSALHLADRFAFLEPVPSRSEGNDGFFDVISGVDGASSWTTTPEFSGWRRAQALHGRDWHIRRRGDIRANAGAGGAADIDHGRASISGYLLSRLRRPHVILLLKP